MTTIQTLADCLPADPADDGPIGIPDSAALRAILDEVNAFRGWAAGARIWLDGLAHFHDGYSAAPAEDAGT